MGRVAILGEPLRPIRTPHPPSTFGHPLTMGVCVITGSCSAGLQPGIHGINKMPP